MEYEEYQTGKFGYFKYYENGTIEYIEYKDFNDINDAYEKYLLKHIFKVNKRFTPEQNLKIQKIKLNEKLEEEKFMEEK